jgi:outer membrane receptor protein involved in Fe transport
MKSKNVQRAGTILLVLFFFTFAVINVWAQSIVSGELNGTLTDPSGAVVPGATITLKNLDTGATQTTSTNNTGAYRFNFLKPGSYQVSITQSGFQQVTRNVQVSVGQSTRSDLRLAVGQSTQTVEVTAQTPLVQTDNGNTQTSFNTAEIAALPSPGGDITYIAQNAPGVAINSSSGGGYGNFTSNGTPATANLFTVNGNDAMDPFLNLNNSGTSNLLLGSNELSEATVTTNGYTGEFGRNAGAQINYATKSGTNNFHGNAIYSYSGAALNARDWFSTPGQANPNSQQHQWAASIGGPIWRDRTFFFVDTEGVRYKLPTSTQVLIPSAAFQATTLASVPAAELPFYQNMFSLWNNAPGANTATPLDADTNEFRSLATNTAHEWILSARVDHQFTAADRVFFRYKTDHGVQPTYTDPINPAFNAISVQPSYEGQANWSHTFGNAIVNQFILSGSYYSAIFKSPDQAAATALFPYSMTSSLFTGLGGINYAFPQGRNVTQYQFVDDLSITAGNHNIKFGGNFRRNDLTDFVYAGRSVTPLVYVLDPATFQAGNWDRYNERFPERLSQPFALASLGLYVQDTWKVSPRFTLTLAVRGDHNSNPVCRTDCFNLASDQFSNLNHDINQPYNQAIQTGQEHAFRNIEAVAWQPRVGFAWTPFGTQNTAIRGGVGVFSDLFPGVFAEYFSRNTPGVNSFTVFGQPADPSLPNSSHAQATAINSAFVGAFNNGGTFDSISNTLLGQGVTFAPPALSVMSNNVKNPKFIKWNLELEQAFGSRTSISLNYNGNHGRDIFVTNSGINAFCDVASCGAPFQGLPTAAPDSRFGFVTQYYNGGVSNYNGFTASVNRKYSQLQLSVSYTWSHTLDDVSNGGILPYSGNDSLLGQINPYNLHSLNYGNADYDIRHYLSANWTWTPGFKFSNGFLNNTFGGWTIGETFAFRTGLPFSVYDSNLGAGGIPNYTPMPLVNVNGGSMSCGAPGSQTAAGCLDPANFSDFITDPSLGFNVNQRRNQFRGPRFFDTDLTVSKLFKVTERVHFGLGATAFNLLNHPNFANPVNDFAEPAGVFGTVQSTVAPPTSPFGAFAGVASGRIVQVTGRLNF